MAKSNRLRERLDRDAVQRIARGLERAWEDFDAPAFVRDATDGLARLELKQRVAHVIEALARHLPSDYPTALAILLEAAEHWEAGEVGERVRGLAAWPLIDFVATYGLDHFDASLEALRRLTPLFSAEFALRAFLEHDPTRTLHRLAQWVDDPNEHVRRLVSEGTRPRLPWGRHLERFRRDPRPTLDLLEQLRDDPSQMVRRSVANHLNDIAKDHPDLVVRVLRRWLRSGPSRRWLVQHATRGLVKAGHHKVWTLLGVESQAHIRLTHLRVEPREVRLGEEVRIQVRLRSRSTRPERLVVTYAVHFVKANGETRPKVFHLRKVELAAGATMELEKTHAFRRLSTRRYYAGTHAVDVRVNGSILGKKSFELHLPTAKTG